MDRLCKKQRQVTDPMLSKRLVVFFCEMDRSSGAVECGACREVSVKHFWLKAVGGLDAHQIACYYGVLKEGGFKGEGYLRQLGEPRAAWGRLGSIGESEITHLKDSSWAHMSKSISVGDQKSLNETSTQRDLPFPPQWNRSLQMPSGGGAPRVTFRC